MKHFTILLGSFLLITNANAQLHAGITPSGSNSFNPYIGLVCTVPEQLELASLDINDDAIPDLQFSLYKSYTAVDGANYASIDVLNSDFVLCNSQEEIRYFEYDEIILCDGDNSWSTAPTYYLGNYGCFGCTGPHTVNQLYLSYFNNNSGATGWIRISLSLNDAGNMEAPITLSVDQVLSDVSGVTNAWLSLPANTTDNGISAGNISITGNAITVEALITMQNSLPIPDAYDIVSKHSNIFDCNYLLRPNNFAVRTSDGFIGIDNPVVLCIDSTYHVAGTYDGDSIRYFVNGAQVASLPWSGSLFENAHITGVGNITFSLDFNEQFSGYLDEVRIWNVARTAEEITGAMYNLPDPTNATGLLAYYKFDGNYINSQGNSLFDGTPYGMDISQSQNPFYTGMVSADDCTPISISEAKNSTQLILFPNPTNSYSQIQCNTHAHRAELCLMNVFGEVIFCKNISAINGDINHRLDLTSLASGTYFVQVKTEDENYCQRIMKVD